jgi:thiol-disulfide isomerase/thioredoxin
VNRRMLIALAVLVAIQAAALGIYRWKRSSRTSAEFAVEKLNPAAAPDLAFERADGSRSSLADARGTVVLVHFWATWCEPCREELPGLLALAKERDLSLVAVSIDDTWEQIRTYFDGNVPSSIARPVVEGVYHRFGASTMPDTYVVDAAGRLTTRYAGARDWSSDRARASLSTTIEQAAKP